MNLLIKIKNILFLLYCFNCVHGAKFGNRIEPYKITLIISMDGFDYRFLNRSDIPHIKHIHYAGTSGMVTPNRPNVGLSNHQTMVTGVTMHDHMIYNYNLRMKDKRVVKYSQEYYNLPMTVQSGKHTGKLALPIWVVNQLCGGKSFCLNWPGAEFTYYGIDKSECEIIPFIHKENQTIEEKFAILSKYLSKNDGDRPNLFLVYFGEPDIMLHPTANSSNVTDNLLRLDKFAEGVLKLKFDLRLENRLNIFQVSDHGYVEIKRGDYLQLYRLVKAEIKSFYATENSTTNPIVSQYVYRDKKNKLFYNCPYGENRERFQKAAKSSKKFIIITVDDGYHDLLKIGGDEVSCALITPRPNSTFNNFKQVTNDYGRDYKITYNDESVFGVHGYEEPGYRTTAIFAAYGKTFRKHVFLKQVEQLDYYPIFLKSIGIGISHTVRSNKKHVEPALRKYSDNKVDWKKFFFTASVSSLSFTTLFQYAVVAYRRMHANMRKKNV